MLNWSHYMSSIGMKEGQECKLPSATAAMPQDQAAGFMEEEDDPMDTLMKQNVLWPTSELSMPLMQGGASCSASTDLQGGEQLVMMKKKRLSMEQVAYLERSFEVDNRLEPERKAQIATELELQPRQVSIWFQNRRARSKNKQLERDYLFLKSQYQEIVKENEKLQAQVLLLTSQLEGLDCKVLDGEKDKVQGSKHKEERKDTLGAHNEDRFEEVGSPASSSSVTFSSSTSIRSFSPKPPTSSMLTITKTTEGITSTITTSTCNPPPFVNTPEGFRDLTEDYSFLFDNNVFITQWEDPTDTTTNTSKLQ